MLRFHVTVLVRVRDTENVNDIYSGSGQNRAREKNGGNRRESVCGRGDRNEKSLE